MKYLLLVLLLSLSLQTFAQESFEDPDEPVIEEQQYPVEEGSFESELTPPASDEVEAPGEIERQEDILFPEGEENTWSLNNEEFYSEEFETE